MAKIDPALEAFDRLRLREVQAEKEGTAATFLSKFQSAAAALGPDERIALVVNRYKGMELLKAVLGDPQASKVCSLIWLYSEKEDVNSIIPLLINSCPELASLQVYFEHHSAFDFVSSVLEHPRNKLKVLDMLEYKEGNLPRFFAALEQSQVSALAISSDGIAQSLCDYLAKDLLVRLRVWTQVPSEMMASLASGTRLAKLEVLHGEFSESTTFPKSITKLALYGGTFVGGFDWSFLAGSRVQELDFSLVSGVDGTQFGGALAVRLRAKGLDELRLCGCRFTDETLAAVGLELGRVKRLELGNVDKVSVELIALALQSPNSELKELALPYENDTADSIETYLAPVLKQPNCNLNKLRFQTYHSWHEAAARTLEDKFRSRRALWPGQQVRRLHCLSPVKMFRLVGKVLI